MNASTLSPPATAPTVYIVEDDGDAREVFEALLKASGFRVQGFSNAEDFLSHPLKARPACAVVDLHLPGISGLALQTKLNNSKPQLPVIVVTGRGDVATARAALMAGARDFLEKPVEPQELVDAVAAALAKDLLDVELARGRRQMAEALAQLTAREQEVFRHITDGLHNREIAVELGISPRTVEVHRARLMERLKARRVGDLFRLRIAMDRPQ